MGAGIVARVLSFVRAQRGGAHVSDTKCDPGGGANVIPEHFSAPGDDAHPLPGDYVAATPTRQQGRYAAVGYVDPVNPPQAGPGEKRQYARDGNGAPVAVSWLKADGEVELWNASGTVRLSADGGILLSNGSGTLTLRPDGMVVIDGPGLVLNGKQIDGHTHPQAPDAAGNAEQNTGGNL